jgi:hypothetical protein
VSTPYCSAEARYRGTAHFDFAYFDFAYFDFAYFDFAYFDFAHFDFAHFDFAHFDSTIVLVVRSAYRIRGWDGDGIGHLVWEYVHV